jgi:hypothetical protein
MEVVQYSETWEFYRTTRRYVPEDNTTVLFRILIFASPFLEDRTECY